MRCAVLQFVAVTDYIVTDLANVQRPVSHDVFIFILFQMSDCNDQYGSSDDTSSDDDFDVVIDNPNKDSDSSDEDESDEATVDDLVLLLLHLHPLIKYKYQTVKKWRFMNNRLSQPKRSPMN